MSNAHDGTAPIPFKAETRQLLDILIHSLYTEREIFLRELISNASDALTRVNYEMLTNRDVLDPDVELAIHISVDANDHTLTISDTGIGMTADELRDNLGTIAHSGARAFASAIQQGAKNITDIIGQFGVGFYSAFMVARSIRVISRSYLPGAQAAAWICIGEDTYTIESADKPTRGTTIILELKQDASEFAQEHRLQEIIRKHSEFISFPIYLGDEKEQINRQTALWRQPPRQVEKKDYVDFYQQLTLDFNPPLTYTHLSVDAPVQMYAILYIPDSPDHGIFSLRKDDGLKLYSRKILIQEYCKDLLPNYFRFIQGVVDTEDLPLNVSRESYQANRIMAQLRKLLSSKVIDLLQKLATDQPDDYAKFWTKFHLFIKEGAATEPTEPEALYPLLRFHTSTHPGQLSSLDDYCSRLQPNQSDIYYLLGEDSQSILHSPHLDYPRSRGYEVLLLTEPVDSFVLVRLTKYKDHSLKNIASADFVIPAAPESGSAPASPEPSHGIPAEEWSVIIDRFKTQLGEKITDVRMTDRLSDSPARLVDPEGATTPELQRVYRYIKEDFEIPKKILELNPHHPLIQMLSACPSDDPIFAEAVEQIFENALLIEGIHPNPANMIGRIHQLIQAALRQGDHK